MREHSREYQEYIGSALWRARRRQVIDRQDGKCWCGEPATDAHHLTYEHLGDEFPDELEALCAACHERAHHDVGDLARVAGWLAASIGPNWRWRVDAAILRGDRTAGMQLLEDRLLAFAHYLNRQGVAESVDISPIELVAPRVKGPHPRWRIEPGLRADGPPFPCVVMGYPSTTDSPAQLIVLHADGIERVR